MGRWRRVGVRPSRCERSEILLMETEGCVNIHVWFDLGGERKFGRIKMKTRTGSARDAVSMGGVVSVYIWRVVSA